MWCELALPNTSRDTKQPTLQRIVFLADGRVTGALTDPTLDTVLAHMRRRER
jgi:hypothetical protein